jgi:hypothetical protein
MSLKYNVPLVFYIFKYVLCVQPPEDPNYLSNQLSNKIEGHKRNTLQK